MIEKLKTLGFDAIDIAVEDPALIKAQEIKKVANSVDMQVTICGAFGPERDFTHSEKKYQKNCHKYLEDLMEISAIVDSDIISGPMYSSTGKARQLSPEDRKKEWDLAIENLRIAGEKARQYGIKLAIEPLNRFETDLCNTAKDVRLMVDSIDLPNVGIMLDNFHMNIEDPNIKDAIEVAGDKIFVVQVSDSHRGIPGTGNFSWEEFKKGLEDINYNGTIVIEGFTTDNEQLAAAVCIWKKIAPSDTFASQGLKFLKSYFV